MPAAAPTWTVARHDSSEEAQAAVGPLGQTFAGRRLLDVVLLEGEPWSRAIVRYSDGKLKETAEAIERWQFSPEDAAGYSVSVLHAALYFVGTSRSTLEALERATQFAGAANYAPVLDGALAAARWGLIISRQIVHATTGIGSGEVELSPLVLG